MPADTRALTRAARRRQDATDVSYTEARDIEREIHARRARTGEDYATAAVHITPDTTEMCQTCGWTYAMACPECTGCGCSRRCSGWRHREAEYGGGDGDGVCGDCGDDMNADYDGCGCW